MINCPQTEPHGAHSYLRLGGDAHCPGVPLRPAGYTAEDGARILAEVEQHPKRALIEALAEATYDLANEDGTGSGGGMWWHLSWAHALVELLPELTLATHTEGDTT